MKSYSLFILFLLCACHSVMCFAQDDKKILSNTSPFSAQRDTIQNDTAHIHLPAAKKDTVKKHDPRIATRRSALIPGWGQAYNKDYWKIPIIYGVLAIPVATYFYNNSYYKKTKFAYEAVFAAVVNNDSSMLSKIDPSVKHSDGTTLSLSTYQNYRNSFRRDRDYSILWFLLAWGLQVADATVFAHLKQFDVSSDLSMEINPVFNNITRTPGLGLTLNLKNPQRKVIAR